MDTLTKQGIIENIILNTGLSRKEAVSAIESLIDIIKETLMRGDDVSLSGFGKWSVRSKTQRRGRNPKTGEEIAIAPRRVVSFSLSDVLRDRLEEKK